MALTEKVLKVLHPFKRNSNFTEGLCHRHGILGVPLYRMGNVRRQSTKSEPSRWDMLSRVDVKRIRKKQVSGIWYIPSPSTTDPLSIITKFPQLSSNDRAILRKAIFLASPGVAKWFDPESSFLREAMNWMYSPILPHQPPHSYVAVVDGLPSPEYFQQWRINRLRPYAPAEGLAICLLSSVQHQPKHHDDDEAPAVLRFRSLNSTVHNRAGERDIFSFLTIPLANTLFVNGLRNTAFYQKWTATKNDGQPILIPRHSPAALTQLQLDVQKKPHRFLKTNVPLYPLTPRRKVVSSMGNVIRELEGDDGQAIRASAELEAMVPKMLAQQQGIDYDGSPEQPQIQVYAKVEPPNASIEDEQPVAGDEATATTDKEERSFDTVLEHEVYKALWNGGKFYRVTSGGGGWGKKAGLLSLDQATDFEPVKAQESGMFPDPDADEDMPDLKREPEVGALVPPGHTIEFLAAKVQKPYPPYFTEQWRQFKGDAENKVMPEQWSEPGTQKVLVGVVAGSEGSTSGRVDEAARVTGISVLPSCFGVLSEGGVSVSVEKRLKNDQADLDEKHNGSKYEVQNRFRVDIPSATFKTKLRPFHLVQETAVHLSSEKRIRGDSGSQDPSVDASAAVRINKVDYTPRARGHARLVRKIQT